MAVEKLINGQPGPHESWRELAEHSLTHDDLPVPGGGSRTPSAAGTAALRDTSPTREGEPRR